MPRNHPRKSHPFEAFDPLGLARKSPAERWAAIAALTGIEDDVPPLIVAAMAGDAAMIRDLLSSAGCLDESDHNAGKPWLRR